jgi:hypothetical protein
MSARRRPMPPAAILDALTGVFEPAPELEAWARSSFIADTGQLANPDHRHLQQAEIGFLWTNEENSRAGRTVIGQCEIMPPMAMGKWQRARAIAQVSAWFGGVPDFLITIDAQAAQAMDDMSFCALIEHELSHAGQAIDEFGMPKFNKRTGLPVWAIKAHEVEEFVGVVKRYGSTSPALSEMVRAINHGPEVGAAQVAQACGTCLRRIA